MAALSTAWADEMLLRARQFQHSVHPKLELMTSQPEVEGAHRLWVVIDYSKRRRWCMNVEKEHPRSRHWFCEEA